MSLGYLLEYENGLNLGERFVTEDLSPFNGRYGAPLGSLTECSEDLSSHPYIG